MKPQIKCKYCNQTLPNMLALTYHVCLKREICEGSWVTSINRRKKPEEIMLDIRRKEIINLIKQEQLKLKRKKHEF